MAKLTKRGTIWYTWIRGRFVSTRCRDKEAARIAAAQLERAAVDPDYHASHGATFGGACVNFTDDLKLRIAAGKRSAKTLEFYEFKCAHLVRLIGDKTPLASINARVVDAYMKKRHEEKAHPNSISKEIVALSQVLKTAKRRGEFYRDLASVLPHGFSPEYQPRKTYLTPDQLNKLLAKQSSPHAAATAFTVATAARKSELEAAKLEDVDLAHWMVTLRGKKTKYAHRKIPVAPPFQELLKFAVETATSAPDGTLFGPWGNMMRDLAVACKRAGVPRVTANDLRRTHATWLRAAGIEPQLIAPVMGHRDGRMVERVYGRLDPERLGQLLAVRTSPNIFPTVASDEALKQHNNADKNEE